VGIGKHKNLGGQSIRSKLIYEPHLMSGVFYYYKYLFIMKIVITESQFNRIIKEETSYADVRIERCKSEFLERFNRFMDSYSDKMSQANKFYNTKKIVDNIKNFVLSKIPQYAWSGYSGGNKWAKELVDFIYKTLNNELQNITWFQKQSIKLLVGNKDNFIEKASDFEYYRDIIDFIDYVCSDIASSDDFKRTFMDWCSNNLHNILNTVAKTTANKIYS
jgi:hypothetical protein